ncbi:MAG: type I-C CRISPR-associated protein Cas5 [Chloroflexi bacterium]|jgi:CRISPR-associated protein Cas5d|nr:type I-C CRISPR-associated protein Cas5 [Chloroflexota bacterium]
MAFGIALRVWGDYACFTRPEMKVERVSYDVITPSAARGILEAIYWKPEIRWVVDQLLILNPVKFTNIRRNELGGKLSERIVKAAMKNGDQRVENFIEEDRQQRAAVILKDVAYVICAKFEIRSGQDNPAKHLDQFNRRARRGQCYHRPYLGCREFPAHFELIEDTMPESRLKGKEQLGWMLHDIDFENDMQARFYNAEMNDGLIDVPPLKSEEVKA